MTPTTSLCFIRMPHNYQYLHKPACIFPKRHLNHLYYDDFNDSIRFHRHQFQYLVLDDFVPILFILAPVHHLATPIPTHVFSMDDHVHHNDRYGAAGQAPTFHH